MALLMLVACARAAPPRVPVEPLAPGLVVTLHWTAPVDLDLYVTDPQLETAYYANARTRSGGVLERDARCADGTAEQRHERVRWTEPPSGRYRVGVDFPEACGRAPAEAAYVITVDLDGRRTEHRGAARRVEREPRVLEFVVPGEGGR